jgi:Cu(I)/Ag(I) efflux system protein CusF
MKFVLIPLAAVALVALPVLAQAGQSPQAPVPMHGLVLAAKGAQAAKSDGEVRKIDKEAGKVTLKHGPIANLGMPPMTMVFRVKDRTLLDKVKVGDKVRFVVEQEGSAMTLTALEPAK